MDSTPACRKATAYARSDTPLNPRCAPTTTWRGSTRFGDHMFEGNEGPSFPAHLYLVSGTATEPSIAQYRVMDNPYGSKTGIQDRRLRLEPVVVVATIGIDSGIERADPIPMLGPSRAHGLS